MIQFDYSITHVPGKQLQIANAISRLQIFSATAADCKFQSDICLYVDFVVQCLPMTDHQLQVVRQMQDTDTTCTQLKSYCQNGWYNRKDYREE